MMCAALAGSAVITSCSDDDDEFGTEQYKGGISLNVWGPSPVARGGELRFLGSGLDNITSITLPGSGDITDIRVISSNEIRITVPQDATPGYVVLHHANGEIKSMTELTFTEPISLESISPMTAKSGDVITIKGEYLNLIKEVIFTEDVIVTEEDFITHQRKEITLRVPDEAQSGNVIISDGAPELPNWIYSESPVTVTLPAAEAVKDITKAKPGDVISIKGSDLDLVRKVTMPNDDEVEFEVKGDVISFTLPANVSDGTVCMIPGSGIKVAIATIGVALPEEVVADPATGVWAGDVIKFKGVNMELVTDITFPGVADAVSPDAKSATEITVTVPEGTQSGDVMLNTGSGVSVPVAVKTLCPENVAYNPSPAPLAGQLTISGRNMQNVKAVILAGTEVAVDNPTATEVVIEVPATLAAGNTTVGFLMTNGETVEGPAIELSAPECAYATELPGEDAEINAGDTFTLPIANESLLTEVQINGTKTQHILQGTNLIILVPDNVGSTAQVTLVSSNGSISYEMAFIPATHVENVIMNEVRDLGSWAGEDKGGAFRLYKDSFKDVPAGAKLVFHINPYAFTQIQLNDANWGSFDTLKPEQSETLVAYELTAEILNRILTTNDGWSETAMVIQGEGTVVSKVHIEWEVSRETVIWEAGWQCSGWTGNQDLAWGGYDWSSVKPNSIMRVYVTETVAAGEWWCVSLRHADGWENLPDPVPSQYDNPAGFVELVLSADILKDLVDHNGLVVSGSEFYMNKITIE